MYNFYDQVNGVSMGSPLGPVFANLFMGYHENKWLQEFDKGKVRFFVCLEMKEMQKTF